MSLQKDIISAFRDYGITIDGIATFRRVDGKNMICVNDDGEYRIVSLNEHNHGYIRQISQSTYNEIEPLDCEQSIMRKVTPLAIVITLQDRTANIENVAVFVKSILTKIKGVSRAVIVSETSDRQAILDEEMLPENNFKLHKLIVSIEEIYTSDNCERDLCINPVAPC